MTPEEYDAYHSPEATAERKRIRQERWNACVGKTIVEVIHEEGEPAVVGLKLSDGTEILADGGEDAPRADMDS